MPRFKVVITEPMPLVDEEMAILKKTAAVKVCPSSDHDTIKKSVTDADVIMVVYARITGDIIESSKNLKGVVRYGVGVDNVDIKRATELGIVVANVPDYATDAVADHAIALLLTLVRRILVANDFMSKRTFDSWTSPSESIRGTELRGKTLGLIGLGRIGTAVAERAKPFGMKIVTFDPYISKRQAQQIGIEFADFDELLRESDFISLHAPLSDETRGIINAVTISKMKKGVFILNTARGPLIDTEALVVALKSGKVAGAALDVFPQEPPDTKDELLALENVIKTPHIAWYTNESLRRLEMTAVQHTLDILGGRIPANIVNKEALSRRH